MRYRHIDALFGEPSHNVIDWALIEHHYLDVMRVVLSVQEGKISSATLLRRLSTYSRRNNFYKAFREIGRVIRTVQLLGSCPTRSCAGGPPRRPTRSSPTTGSPSGAASATTA